MFVSDVSHSAPIKSYFNHSYIMSCCFSSSSLVFTGPRCPWGPVYGSRCLCLRDLWLKRCCIFCIPLHIACYVLEQLYGAYRRPMNAIFNIYLSFFWTPSPTCVSNRYTLQGRCTKLTDAIIFYFTAFCFYAIEFQSNTMSDKN